MTMYYKQLIKIALFLIMGSAVGTASAQAVVKVGDNPYFINDKAALDVESTTKGFLPPRMTKAERDAIISPPAGLQVWCTNSNISTDPVSGELCIYTGSGWVPFTLLISARLTTGKKVEANKPVRVSATSATIKGVLVSISGPVPTETGIVWREISVTDFDSYPILDPLAAAVAPTYKTVGTLVTTDGAAISVTIPSLTSATLSTRPYYFRTFAKTPIGIGYGNPVIFNCAPPVISAPVVASGTTLFPTFSGTLTVNAGTPQGTITEYGYCSGTTSNPTTSNDKVMLSTTATLAALDATLSTEVFTADPTVALPVSVYDTKVVGTTYFRYYVIANGTPVYSSQATFTPVADPVTGGSAIASLGSIDPISANLQIGLASSSTIKVNFTVIKAGSYASFVPGAASGATTGLTIPTVVAGSFALGAQFLSFAVSGTPATSLVGNSFVVPRIGSLTTGAIAPMSAVGGNALCDALHSTTVVPITSSTGKIWMDRNLGASRAGTSSTDYEAYGCLYQWGRGNDGHASINWTSATAGTSANGTTATLATTDSPGNALFITNGTSPYDWRSTKNDNLWQGVAGINNPCPSGYRVSTGAEFAAEVTAYSITNFATAYTSPYKFVAVGNRNETALFVNLGSVGIYWSSTVSGTDAYRRVFGGVTNSLLVGRTNAYSVRCIKD
jgi:hypothetical protein